MRAEELEQRWQAMSSSGGTCEVCGAPFYNRPQGAHRIANTLANRKKWGDSIIDHPLNIAIVCSLECNQDCNIGQNPGKCWDLVYKIASSERRRYQ